MKTPAKVKTPVNPNADRYTTCHHLRNYAVLIRTYSPSTDQADEALRFEKSLNKRMAKLSCQKLTPQQLANLRRRFFAKVKKTRGCWLWQAGVDDGGYGFIQTTDTKKTSAHRASWIIHYGEIPSDLWVLHNCPGGDRRDCVNPLHLWLGTAQENTADMVKKQRQAKGIKNNQAKLTDDKVFQIFHLLQNGQSKISLARKFKVCIGTISAIFYSKTWKHIKRPVIKCDGHPKGQKNPSSKLTETEVVSIVTELKLGATARGTARAYSVSQRCIQFIRDNKTWKHIPRP